MSASLRSGDSSVGILIVLSAGTVVFLLIAGIHNFANQKAPAVDARARQTTGALTFREPMLFENRKAPAVITRCLSHEASQVQTNTRDQESSAIPILAPSRT
jgi:hypothetical protein